MEFHFLSFSTHFPCSKLRTSIIPVVHVLSLVNCFVVVSCYIRILKGVRMSHNLYGRKSKPATRRSRSLTFAIETSATNVMKKFTRSPFPAAGKKLFGTFAEMVIIREAQTAPGRSARTCCNS